MSSRIRKVKVHRQAVTLKELLKDEKKRVRFIFLILGVLLIGLGILFSKPRVESSAPVTSSDQTTSFSQEPVKVDKLLTDAKAAKDKSKEPPVRILIPDLKIDLSVKEAKVVKGFWEVFPDSAAFGMGSAYPDASGNQVIFAHAREGLFLPLRKAVVGQKIIVFTKNKWFEYKIKEIKEVLPSQTEVIAPTDGYILTLYTCSGFSDSKRLIVVAEKISV